MRTNYKKMKRVFDSKPAYPLTICFGKWKPFVEQYVGSVCNLNHTPDGSG